RRHQSQAGYDHAVFEANHERLVDLRRARSASLCRSEALAPIARLIIIASKSKLGGRNPTQISKFPQSSRTSVGASWRLHAGETVGVSYVSGRVWWGSPLDSGLLSDTGSVWRARACALARSSTPSNC